MEGEDGRRGRTYVYSGKCGKVCMWVVGRGYIGADFSCESLFLAQDRPAFYTKHRICHLCSSSSIVSLGHSA